MQHGAVIFLALLIFKSYESSHEAAVDSPLQVDKPIAAANVASSATSKIFNIVADQKTTSSVTKTDDSEGILDRIHSWMNPAAVTKLSKINQSANGVMKQSYTSSIVPKALLLTSTTLSTTTTTLSTTTLITSSSTTTVTESELTTTTDSQSSSSSSTTSLISSSTTATTPPSTSTASYYNNASVRKRVLQSGGRQLFALPAINPALIPAILLVLLV